jgi:biopolymer transport protein TolR
MAMSLGKKGYNSEINITPYIDILLVLLIIFMVATPRKVFDQEVRIPKPAPVQQQPVQNDSVILEVDLNREIRLNTHPVPFADLQTTLYAVFTGRVDKNMFIRGDPGLEYGYVFQILDIAKRSGVADIALLSKQAVPAVPAKPAAGSPPEVSQLR